MSARRAGIGAAADGRARVPEGYDPSAFVPFAVTVDLAVFTVRESRLHVLLVERGQEPYLGAWALPGGFVLPKESAGQAARRELAEETGLSARTAGAFHLEQLRTYSEPDRDPRMRVVSVAYTALLPDLPEPRGGGDAARAQWVEFGPGGAGGAARARAGSRGPVGSRRRGPGRPLAFDHEHILADAYDRVGAKLEYTCLATAFCPAEFTLGELRQVYETVWGVALDPPNFRRKVLTTPGFVQALERPPRRTGGRGKPAALYRAGAATALHPPLLRPDRPEGRTE
ncbi:NUDIX hydrolase [Streptomyces lushanensis]|uniref:NUDIX hydrolase n=1 Tax=Streptomyces lushanensis TaxID=1434255 RepID=UPI000B29D78E|nr:NUDIX domain-containing protein [Streptomyces lushanensis]